MSPAEIAAWIATAGILVATGYVQEKDIIEVKKQLAFVKEHRCHASPASDLWKCDLPTPAWYLIESN
jgi:hypothetical protein